MHIAYSSTRLGMTRIEKLHEKSHVYFTEEFLLYPPRGWTVDFSHAACEVIAMECKMGDTHDDQCFAGVLVKCEEPQRVWRLTGEYDWCGNGYEARWPD